MASVAKEGTTRGVLPSDTERSIIAHLRGGPFADKEFVLYRARQFYTPRVSRGAVRRALRMSRRYAWYELVRTWEESELLHGEYEFRKIRGERRTLDRAA
jgi:hypothetical protein